MTGRSSTFGGLLAIGLLFILGIYAVAEVVIPILKWVFGDSL